MPLQADTKRPKSPSILTKLLASFKNDNKKTKAPKSPTKKEKEKDKKKEEEAEASFFFSSFIPGLNVTELLSRLLLLRRLQNPR